MKTLIRLAGLSAVLAIGSVTEVASADPLVFPPDPITVFNRSENGSGCPAGSVNVVATPDGSTLEVTYSKFVASVDASTSPFDLKNCIITFGIHVPQGFRYTITTVDYRGYFALSPNVLATATARYFIAGDALTAVAKSNFVGNVNHEDEGGNAWQRRDVLQFGTLVWSPCGGEVISNINQEIKVNKSFAAGGQPVRDGNKVLAPALIVRDDDGNPVLDANGKTKIFKDANAWGEIGQDSTSLQLKAVYALQWEKCTP
jgi:hypothetical protein